MTYLGEVEVSFDREEREEDIPLLACEVLFAKHNADDRPDGRICPSMSVGDVVALQDQLVRSSPVEYYACQTVGFVKLRDKPVHTTTDFWTVLADEMRRRASSWRG